MATNGASAGWDDNIDTINMDLMSTSMSGNLSFDVVLSPPRANATPRASKIPTPTSASAAPISLDAITTKMKTAEENRGRRLDEKLEKIKEHEKHVEEVRKSRDLHTLTSGEDSLRKSMMAAELRQQHLEELVKKLKEHEKRIEQVHKRLAGRNEAETEELERQLEQTSADRNMVLLVIKEKQQQRV